jgi:molybdopterin-guanine dinucleotide biosynthesis protein A
LRSVYYLAMDGAPADVAAFVLAGGKSTRMSTDKAFVLLDGRTLLDRALELARSVTSEVRIVGDGAKFAAFAPVVEDIFPGCGPLGGIHAALRRSTAELNLMLAVDLPFLPPQLLEFFVTRARDSEVTVTVARLSGRLQPLCAVYRREFGDAAEQALRAGRYKIGAVIDEVRKCVVDEEELQSRGFAVEMFRNLNTPEDLASAAADQRARG